LSTTIILMIILQLIVKKTKMGRAMRAAAADPVAAELMGININGTISFVFAIGSAMAGAAGVLIGLYYNSIDPTMGLTPGIKAFVAAVVGGVGSIPGAAVGAVIIGCLESMMQAIGFSAFQGRSRLCCFDYRIAVLAGRSVWQQAARKGLREARR
jgi:branched-chain amino acid transport system permease protein